MKLVYIIFVLVFSINSYSQETVTPSKMLQRIVGKWGNIDENDLTIIISKSKKDSTAYNVEFISVSSSGRTGEFQGEVIYTNQKSFLVDKSDNTLGFLKDNYFVKSPNNEIVGSLKLVHDMLYFQSFTNLCDVEEFGSCGLGVTLSSGYLKRF